MSTMKEKVPRRPGTITGIVCFVLLCQTALSTAGELELGYGREFRGNEDLEQFELSYSHQLGYHWGGGDSLELRTALEAAVAYLREDGGDNGSGLRFSLMPQLLIGPENSIVHLVLGFGAGLMGGETEFTDHDLGGPFLLNSKVGLRLIVAERVTIEYDFYHQSNAGLYDHNAGLSMNMVSIGLSF